MPATVDHRDAPMVDQAEAWMHYLEECQAAHPALYREVEELAARGDSNALRLRLTVAEHQLGLPSLDQED